MGLIKNVNPNPSINNDNTIASALSKWQQLYLFNYKSEKIYKQN
jgi:hypothetical protein